MIHPIRVPCGALLAAVGGAATPGVAAAQGAPQPPAPARAPADGVCPSGGEFGTHGCARGVVLLAVDSAVGQPADPRYRVWVTPAPGSMAAGFSEAYPRRAYAGSLPVTILRWTPPAAAYADTVSVWVAGFLWDDRRPVRLGQRLPILAAGSVLHRVRFAAQGAVAPADTVRLRLRAPGAPPP